MKNVHIAGKESLSTVRVFSASGKPVNGSKRQAADDTETETEYDSSSVPNEPTSFPFPIMGPSSSESDPAFQLDFMRCLSVPSTNLPWYVNVLFETGHSTLHQPSEARLQQRPQAASNHCQQMHLRSRSPGQRPRLRTLRSRKPPKQRSSARRRLYRALHIYPPSRMRNCQSSGVSLSRPRLLYLRRTLPVRRPTQSTIHLFGVE